MKLATLSLLSAFIPLVSTQAALVEEPVVYQKDGVTMEGYHVYDDAVTGKRPGVLVVHQWMGLTENEKHRSRMLAELGYNVVAADIYGKGVRPQTMAEAGAQAGKYKGDRALYRSRLMAGLDVLQKDERTDASMMAAIGYCFGGTGVLEMARAGVDLRGVVSFHGGLDSADGMKAQECGVKAKIFALHGAEDPIVPPKQVEDFQKEMTAAKADWQMVYYCGAVHAFTQVDAGNDPSKGVAYNAAADRRSWAAMKSFFAEIFAK